MIVFLAAAAGFLTGAVAVYLVMSARVVRLNGVIEAERGKVALKEALGTAELAAERDKITALKMQYDETMLKAEDRFKTIAQEILEDRSKRLQAEGEKGMSDIARGVENVIREFRERIEKINSDSTERTGRLDARISGLITQTNAVSDQANRLAEAIRGEAQVTGAWGEMQLKKVLELGGLQETVDYTYQETFASAGSDHKDIRTDVLVKMTDGRWMVIDSKTTLRSYVDYRSSVDEEEKRISRDRVVESLQRHVEEMKVADYRRRLEQSTGKNVLGTMLMYIPFDEVYLIAMKAEISVNREKVLLRDWAAKNGIVFVNASSLLPMAKMLSDFWSAAKADRKALEIKTAAEALAEKLRLFLAGKDGFSDLGGHLAAAVRCYNSSVGRLAKGPGNVVKRLADIADMGVDVRNLPSEDETAAREINCVVEDA